MTLTIGSLFSGYGGLDMGVQAVLGGEVAWHVEFDSAPSKILAHHWPDIPNYGDITTVDWSKVPPVDILTGGFPCQDLSLAGRRAGMRDGTRSGLWADYLKAIDALRPGLVLIENVRGLLSGCAESDLEPCPGCVGEGEHRPVLRALGRVLGDLAGIGYDAEWVGLRAADAGAPHGRFRVFVLAYPDGERRGEGRAEPAGRIGRLAPFISGPPNADAANNGHERAGSTWDRRPGLAGNSESSSYPTGCRCDGRACVPVGGAVERAAAAGGGLDTIADAGSERLGQYPGAASSEEARSGSRDFAHGVGGSRADTNWGPYRPAIERWEQVTGRVAPSPTKPDGKNGNHRLSAAFVEWIMGLPAGHVTAPEIGLTRNEQLKACGNGVVPQQAALALTHLLTRERKAA